MIALYALFALASLGTFLSGVAAVMGLRNHKHLDKVSDAVNGRVDQLVTATREAAHANAVLETAARGDGQPQEGSA